LTALTAVGLAALANIKKDPKIMMLARSKYTLSLRQMEADVSDPAKVVKEQTIAAIFMMSMFEVQISPVGGRTQADNMTDDRLRRFESESQLALPH
jgi:hypothetical protein